MEKKDNKISLFQFMAILALISNSVFVGYGIIITFQTSISDTWVVPILGIVIGLIPTLIFMYIMSYKPEKNIFEKNKSLFGNVLGIIVNSILTLIIAFMILLVKWSLCSFTVTIYLTKTPEYIISLLFIAAAIFAIYKGIETIARTSEILLYLSILMVSIIIIFLSPYIRLDELKPFFANGLNPIINSVLLYVTYLFTPTLIMTVIPKNNIINNQKLNKYILFGFGLSSLLMFLVFFIIPAIITPNLARIYRFPAYYVLRKVTIGGAINNLENVLSLHWIINQFILILMALYFIKEYFKDLFKVKNDKINLLFISIVGVIIVYFNHFPVLENVVVALNFMKKGYPILIGGTLLIISIIACIMIKIKKVKMLKE